MQIQTPDNSMPAWVLTSLLGLLFGICIGLFTWVVNRILNQQDDSQKQNQKTFEKLTDAVVSIEKTTAVQTEMLRNHTEDIRAHDEILKSLVKTTKR